MTAEVVWHPRSRPAIAILGGTHYWLVVPVLGDRPDERWPDLRQAFNTLDSARRYAAAIAQGMGVEVEIRRSLRAEGGAAA